MEFYAEVMVHWEPEERVHHYFFYQLQLTA